MSRLIRKWGWFPVILIMVQTGWAGGLDWPDPPTDEAAAAARAAHPDVDEVVLQDWIGWDLKYVEKHEGLSGRLMITREVLICDKDAIAAWSSVSVVRSPVRILGHYEIIADGPSGRRRWKKKDLKWLEGTERGDGIVMLDGVVSAAFLPGIEVGDRIRVSEEYEIKGLHGLPGRLLGIGSAPYTETILELRLPREYEISWRVRGSGESRDRLDFHGPEDLGSGRYRWRMMADADGGLPVCRKQYPVVRVGTQLLSVGDDKNASFSFGPAWEDVGEAYLQRIDGLFASDGTIDAKAIELTADVETVPEKVERIYTWVQNRCHYLGLYEGADNIIPRSAASVNELGSGDCKGLGALLIAMLRSAGVSAHPVLVLTTGGGSVFRDLPNISQFNHFIVWVDDGDNGIYLDATTDRFPAGVLPHGDAGSPVLRLVPGAVELVEVPDSALSPGVRRCAIVGQIDETFGLSWSLADTVSGYLARAVRDLLDGRSAQDTEKMVGRYITPVGLGTQYDNVAVDGLGDWSAPVLLTATMKTVSPLPVAGDRLFLPRTLSRNEMTMDTSVPCGSGLDISTTTSQHITWRFELPSGWALATPDSIVLSGPGVTWSRRTWQEGRSLHLERKLELGADYVRAAEMDSLNAMIEAVHKAQSGYMMLNRP